MRFVATLLILACSPESQPVTPTRRGLEIKDVSRANVEALQAKLAELDADASTDEIWLRINSHGGDVDAGMELVQTFENLHKPLVCVVDTKAWSMGMSLLQGCPKRYMTARSSLMMHEVLVQEASGNRHELEDNANAVRVLSETLIQLAASRLKLTTDEIRAKITGRQWWLDSTEALDVGAVDGIIDAKQMPYVVPVVPHTVTLRELLGG